MGARQVTWAALAAVCLLPARVPASVQIEPVARLSLEGGYDSNVAFEGSEGQVARVSPDLGLQLRDHTWTLRTVYGLDLFHYPTRAEEQVLNHRGGVELEARLSPRTELDVEGLVSWAPDPIAVATLGYVVPPGDALLWRADAKLSRRWTRRLTLAATFRERAARLSGSGVALHAPGVEAAWRLDARTEVGGSYRLDVFQRLGDSTEETGTAHEALAFARWRWTRRLRLEAEAGPALWNGREGPAVVPVAAVALHASGRKGDLRVSARHGIGINALARSSLTDSVEGAVSWRFARPFVLRGYGGFWHGGLLPDGDAATTGYGVSTEIAWLVRRGLEVGVVTSRYARLDDASPDLARNQIGVRAGWTYGRRY